MMLHGSQPQSPSQSPSAPATTTTTQSTTTTTPTNTPNHDPTPPAAGHKRKADTEDNERLRKRMSLLSLERDGSKLYVPVENPKARGAAQASELPPVRDADDSMQLDDSKYKVYIYNIDDELSSEDESEPDDGRLVFLQDIDKHLKANRIPPSVLANSEGELAGMQMVLYNDPKSLSVPEEKDSVRKAIIESRHRTREKQRQELDGEVPAQPPNTGNVSPEVMADDPVVAPVQQDLDAMDID